MTRAVILDGTFGTRLPCAADGHGLRRHGGVAPLPQTEPYLLEMVSIGNPSLLSRRGTRTLWACSPQNPCPCLPLS